MNATMPRLLPTAVRWLARGTGLALFLLVSAIAIGHWPLPNPFSQPLPVALEFLLMAAMMLGLVVAWRWELIGALVSLAALVGFYVVEWVVNGKIAGGFLALFAVPGVLYVLDVMLRRPAPRELA